MKKRVSYIVFIIVFFAPLLIVFENGNKSSQENLILFNILLNRQGWEGGNI